MRELSISWTLRRGTVSKAELLALLAFRFTRCSVNRDTLVYCGDFHFHPGSPGSPGWLPALLPEYNIASADDGFCREGNAVDALYALIHFTRSIAEGDGEFSLGIKRCLVGESEVI